jgi:hypothetical protein
MLVAVIAPELMVGFAARQFLAAREFSKGQERLSRVCERGFSPPIDFGVSETHGFFFYMGGFVSRAGRPIATHKQLIHPDLGPEYISAIRGVEEEDIMDKSEGDALFKGVALAQGLWFTAQCLARVSQRLPITELEVATLAFAVVNVFMWLLWWGKPHHIQRPIPIGPSEWRQGNESAANLLTLWDKFMALLIGSYSDSISNEISSTSGSFTAVPILWSMDQDKIDGPMGAIAFLMQSLVGTLFGAIHCAAWNANFPSTAEMWAWRASSLLVAGTPVIGCIGALASIFDDETIPFRDATRILKFVFVPAIPSYFLARTFLILIPFTTLRALPPGAFIDVDWSVYIPHL